MANITLLQPFNLDTTKNYTFGSVTATGNVVGGNVLTGGLISATGNIRGGNILGNGYNLSGINAFSTISVTGQSNVVANTIASPLTLAAGVGISITTDASNSIVSFSTAATDIFATGGSMGTVTEAVTTSQDLGTVTSAVSGTTYDLGTIGVDGVVTNDNIAFYTITGNRLANNFSYGSNFSVTGNIVGSGNISASANIYSGGIVVPNQDQVVAYIFAF